MYYFDPFSRIFYERMIKIYAKDTVKRTTKDHIYLRVLLQIFPAPFTETRYPRFIFGPPYRSQRRPATCCSIWVRPAGPYHFVSLPACPGPSLDHSSRHECGRSAEAAFSIPLSSTPIFSLLFLSSNVLFLGRDRKIFFTNFPRLTRNFKLLSRFIPIIYIPYYICHPIKKLLHLWSINSLLVKVVEIENNIFFSWRALLINSS